VKNIKKAVCYALLAAALYALNMPLSKLLLPHVGATMMAALLYLGAGLGLFLYGIIEKLRDAPPKREPLTKKELSYTIAMVVLDRYFKVLGLAIFCLPVRFTLQLSIIHIVRINVLLRRVNI
jgi:drug/metabolite transporter (DMT)-like permease